MPASTDTTQWVITGSRSAAEAADPRWATHCLLDWLGVAVAGAAEPLVDILARTVLPESTGPASTVGRPGGGQPWDVAMVNGAAGHALDYDDSHPRVPGHTTAVVLPALLAAGEQAGASGADLLAALTAGTEAACRVAALVGPGHYAAGLHATSTIGTFGAASGCAHLLRLNDPQWTHALGLAAAHAAGLRAQFGTMAKPLQVGRAAADGLRCAVLAKAGFTAASDGVLAFARASHGERIDLDEAGARLGRCPAIAGVVFKRHAACHLTHATIDNARKLRDDGVTPAGIESITVTVPPDVVDVCRYTVPETGLAAKFSLHTTVALGLLGSDTTDPATFTDDLADDPAVRDIGTRVTVHTAPAGKPLTWSHLLVRDRTGRCWETESDSGVPDDRFDTVAERLRAKARTLAGRILPNGAAGMLDAVAALPSATTLTALLASTQPSTNHADEETGP